MIDYYCILHENTLSESKWYHTDDGFWKPAPKQDQPHYKGFLVRYAMQRLPGIYEKMSECGQCKHRLTCLIDKAAARTFKHINSVELA